MGMIQLLVEGGILVGKWKVGFVFGVFSSFDDLTIGLFGYLLRLVVMGSS